MDINKITDVLSLSPLVLLMVLSIVIGEFCWNDYHITYGCDLAYPNILKNTDTVHSITECSWRCSREDRCLSVKYDLDNRTCQLNSERYLSWNSDCQAIFEYATLTKRSCGKLINQDCTVLGECSVLNSQCILNKCLCEAGYSYDYKTESCVESCDVYGHTYTRPTDYRLYHADNKYTHTAKTVETCEQACTEETTFVCRSINFWVWNACYLSPATALTTTAHYIPDNQSHYYQRNCQ